MRTPNVDIKGKTVLVTGAAGFIGSHLILRLLRTASPIKIVGIDNVNDYYDTSLKEHRLAEIAQTAKARTESSWQFVRKDITSPMAFDTLFAENAFDVVVHLAAQTGVRHSISDPEAYIESNIIGFFRMLEACRKFPPKHLVYASSSSVYGSSSREPYSTEDKADAPLNLYAATKKSNELMAYAYSSLYGIPTTGLRLFTVYGPSGRPDMAYFSFTDSFRDGKDIQLFASGEHERDFTYVDDVVEGIVRVMRCAPEKDSLHAVYNIGTGMPIRMCDFVHILHEELLEAGILPPDFSLEEHIELAPAEPGDALSTCADIAPLKEDFGFSPSTPLREGLREFAEWYRSYYF